MSRNKSIIFAHGIWADGSCFSKLIPPLRAEGYEVLSSQHGLDDHQADVDCCVRNIARATRPVVLVGHSYGGSVITAAGTDDRVVALVYISALGPDEEETSQDQQDKFPKTDIFGKIEVAEGRVGCSPRASTTSWVISARRRRRLCSQPPARLTQTYSIRRPKASPGGTSRAGASWRKMTVPSTLSSKDLPQSAWVQRPLSWPAATFPCCRSPKPFLM